MEVKKKLLSEIKRRLKQNIILQHMHVIPTDITLLVYFAVLEGHENWLSFKY